MKNLDRLLSIHNELLNNHISTKVTYSQFHEKSASFYEVLFDAFHTISEKRVDIGLDTIQDEEEIVQNTYDLIEEAKGILEAMVKEKNSVGMDNLLRSLCDRIEWICGDCKAFIAEEMDEADTNDSTEKDTPKIGIPVKN